MCLWASRSDFRDPGWGDPGFPQRDVAFAPSPGPFVIVMFSCLFALPKARDLFSTQAAGLIRIRAILSNMTFFVLFFFVCCCLCFLFFVFGFGALWLFPVFCFWLDGIELDRHWTV